MEDNVTFGCKCKYQCKNIQSLGLDIGKLYPEFLTLDKNAQRTYLLGQIHLQNVARRRHGTYSDPSESRRQVTIRYTVPDGKGGNVQVCSSTFKTFFGITSRKLQTLQTKKKKGCLIYCDERGKSNAKRKSHSEEERYLVPAIFTSSSVKDYQDCYTVPEIGRSSEKETKTDESWQEDNEFSLGMKVEACSDILNSEEVFRSQSLIEQEHMEQPRGSTFADVEIALLHLHQEKLLLELEKISEERERIATEKKNIILHSEILKLRLQLMGCSRSAQTGINSDSNNVGTENVLQNVNVSVSSHSVQQIENSSTGKPKSCGLALGTESKLTQLLPSKTTSSVCPENPLIMINKPPNMNSQPTHKQSSSTSNYPASFKPNKRYVLSDTVENPCVMPVTIPSSASHFLAPLLNIEGLSPPMTHLNSVQTGISNSKTSGISGSSQIGLVLQECNSYQQRLLYAKPATQSMPTTSCKDVLATSPTPIVGPNPPPVASSKTILKQTVNSSLLNSSSRLERLRKAQESTDDFIVPYSKDSSMEWDKCITVASSDSTAGSVTKVKEKIDIEGPSKKLRLSTEDNR